MRGVFFRLWVPRLLRVVPLYAVGAPRFAETPPHFLTIRKYSNNLFNRPMASLELNLRVLKAEVLDALVYGALWSPNVNHDSTMSTKHRRFLLRSLVSASL